MEKQLLTERDDIFVVRGFLSPEECDRFIERSERVGYGEAPINAPGGPIVHKGTRDNERVIIDDTALAVELWERTQPLVPESWGSWRACGLNERFRFYRYTPGQRFHWHFDGSFQRSPWEVSTLTFMVYLNEGFEGGATEFNLRGGGVVRDSDPLLRVIPEQGMLLVFTHNVLHQGATVVQGTKYVLRSDVMYRRPRDG